MDSMRGLQTARLTTLPKAAVSNLVLPVHHVHLYVDIHRIIASPYQDNSAFWLFIRNCKVSKNLIVTRGGSSGCFLFFFLLMFFSFLLLLVVLKTQRCKRWNKISKESEARIVYYGQEIMNHKSDE